ncbi:paraquat-inducible protein A [Paraglaciecola sp. 2405UD69-4]|uniref:paraquat-inducible protein A n=1 Tax=Paraglaciecola sp. 2405UD69-4 TaxID=3391836 RepID=UPI0039C8D59E
MTISTVPDTRIEPSSNQAIRCHECHYHVTIPVLTHKQAAYCPRCNYQLTVYHDSSSQKIIALAITGLLLLAASIPFEFLSFSASGQSQSINLVDSFRVLIENNFEALALLEAIFMLILPGAILITMLYVLIPLELGKRLPKTDAAIDAIFILIPWAMAEIFLIGVLVSLIKIMSLADISIGFSFYAYLLFTVCMTITLFYVDKYHLKTLLNLNFKDTPKKLNKSLSVQKTWALLITSSILYIPANVLPIMYTNTLGDQEPSTIIGGVILLWKMGSYPIAIIIFIASVFVPIAKLVILTWLNYSVQTESEYKRKERVYWYRITEFIGRWSMIDVFVVAILVSLIQLDNLMSVVPGNAALAFCGVVICTMLAAITFDSRLIWLTSSSKDHFNHDK